MIVRWIATIPTTNLKGDTITGACVAYGFTRRGAIREAQAAYDIYTAERRPR